MRPTTPRPLTDTPYVPPQRLFWPCEHCGALVLHTPAGLVTPLLGYPHVCSKEEKHEREPAHVGVGSPSSD